MQTTRQPVQCAFLTDAEIPLPRPRPLGLRVESPSGSATPTRTLCGHTQRYAYAEIERGCRANWR